MLFSLRQNKTSSVELLSDFRAVTFPTAFDSDDIVVFATIQTYHGNAFVKTRIREVTRTGFEISLQVSPDSWWFSNWEHGQER
eukprot:UN02414